MKDQVEKVCLQDGVYPCSATLHIKDGKAVIVLHSMFDLAPGAIIPLYRKAHEMKVVSGGGDPIGIKNGHAII
jgi:hypothetical protein